MLILAVESSCDDTSVALVRMGERERKILSCRTASQTETHKLYGGVVPEIASRAHIEAISSLCYAAFDEAGCTPEQVELVGVTAYPGLIGSLFVGVNFAKSLAYAYGKPLVAVNHTHAHAAAAYLGHPDLRPPFLALTVSGGHTSLSDVRDYTEFEVVGRTRDDAAGEAFDKVARVMGIPYPGGAEIDKLASLGDPDAIHFPSAAIAGDTLDLSFSGLKTAVINYLNTASQRGDTVVRENVAAALTRSVTSSLVCRVGEAVQRSGRETVVLAGGVAANSHLRAELSEYCEKHGLRLCMAPRHLCGDNAAMVGAQAYYEYLAGNRADLTLAARATE